MNEKKSLILVVDDEPANLMITERILSSAGYDTLSASGGVIALDILNKNPEIDLVLLDIMMPDMNGYDVCKNIKAGSKVFQDIPIIFLTAVSHIVGIAKGFEVGGVDYIVKPFQKIELLARIKTHLKIKAIKDEEIEQTQKELIYMISHLTDIHTLELKHHVKRVSEYAKLFALLLGYDEKKANTFRLATALHDVGKIGLSNALLAKEGKLTPSEILEMQAHTTIGYHTLSQSQRPLLKAAAIVAYQHHEKYDGSGYPRGLIGEEIHILGRVAAISDVMDGLDTTRTYKQRWPLNDIFAYIQTQSGKHFDPKLVSLLIDNYGMFIEVRDKYENS